MYKKLAIAAMVSIALYGCGAEERSYDTLPRATEQISKSSLDTESLWLYMPSTGATPRYAVTQRGFFQGTPKLVKLRFDKQNGIIAEEIDRDTIKPGEESRYADVINQAPVLKIPGTFQQYRCAEDNYDECTNKEELNEDADLNWEETTHFTPDYAGIESLAVDTVDAWWTADNVDETADPRVTHWEYDAESGTINVEVERTFSASPDDAYLFGNNLEDLSFKTRFFYSLVKLDKLASPDYQIVQAPGRDSLRFGFFNVEKSQRSLTGESGLQGQSFNLLKRFNPNAPIEYYLSDSYFDKENKLYLDVTLETIREINRTLKGTGVPTIKIMNESQPAGVHTGDLRYNVLNLITDPVDNGLLGYGPSASNPLTGEIVHAHVNQYAGVIRSTSRRMWNELVMRYNREEIERPAQFIPQAPPSDNTASIVANDNDHNGSSLISVTAATSAPLVQSEPRFINGVPRWLTPPEQEADTLSRASADYQKQLNKMAEQNMYAAEFMWVSTKSKGLIKGIDYLSGGYFDNQGLEPSAQDYTAKVNTKLKSWNHLNKDQQQEVSDAITRHMFKSTLVHELGHNLGLRHNFMGSVDKANFYQQDEINTLGYEKVPAYSSVMDYGASIFDELPTYGKYDIAALRYGYGRKVETLQPDNINGQTSEMVSLKAFDKTLENNYNAYPRGILDELAEHLKNDSPDTKLKQYNFCTDENVTSQTTCNRFDEGTNVLELTQFRIQKYWDNYDLVNRRDNRENFYDFNLHNYSLHRINQFSQIRDVIEDLGRYDNLIAMVNNTAGENSYGSNVSEFYTRSCTPAYKRKSLNESQKIICDTYDASLLAANFFIQILETPDKVCEVKIDMDGSSPSYKFIPLSNLWLQYQGAIQHKTDLPRSCFDPELTSVMENGFQKITVLSETRDGRPLDNMRANNPYQNSHSAVDLLGVWPDKLLAAQLLVKRSGLYHSSNDKSNMALIDISSTQSGTQGTPQKLKTYLGYLGFGMDSYRDPIFIDKDGVRKDTIKRYVPDIKRSIDIPGYLVGLKWYFQLSQETVTPLYSALLHNLVAFGWGQEYGLSDSSKDLIDDITLTQPSMGSDENDSFQFSWKARNYLITRRNGLAKHMAEKALLINGKDVELAKLEKANPRTKRNLNTKGLRSLKDLQVILLRDPAAIEELESATHFESLFRGKGFPIITEPAKFTFNKADDCYSPATDNSRCHKKENLHAAWNAMRVYKDIDPDYLNILLDSAKNYASYISQEINEIPEDATIYDIDPEIIWLWDRREYIQYRYALEQLPVLPAYY
ncbi:zinc-dependent metalloprotease [Photobacterium atrarenae]|uniref:Zinc-dependent metalloprotease n=1 Tax=Photobacterium atrarenae TaxID=865757 RepID=A0ABY5GDT2_9GAMM|nr:zinc-dependent metalloprotease [Photobacterium atrarenae]UTV27351.1 zinc-dependent metalloprotease [Photobacterium atrarenae]